MDTASIVHWRPPRTGPVLYTQRDPSARPERAQQPRLPGAQNLQAGPVGPSQRSPGQCRVPPGPLWRRAQALPGRPTVYPRSRQQGAPFRFGSRGRGGRRCAAPRCAPARTGPGPLDAASPLLLPAGRAPVAGECGAAGPAGSSSSSSSPVPWKRRPGLPALVPGRAAKLGAGDAGPIRSGAGGRAPAPLPARAALGGRTGWPSVWEGSGLGGAQVAPSCGVQAAAWGCKENS